MALNLTGANVAMRSQMTGIPQRQDGMSVRRREVQVRHREEITTQREKPTRETPTDKFTPSNLDDTKPKVRQRKAQQVIARYVSDTGNAKSAKDAQTKDTKQVIKQEEPKSQEKPQDNAPKAPVDNASRIGLMYQQKMRKQKSQQGKVNNDQPAAQQNRLKSFLGNLKKMVKLEYQQYTKPEISPYSRRNLREVMSALGENVKAFDNKSLKDRKDRQNSNVSNLKFYNKHHASRASRHLKLFHGDPMQDPNYDPFEMIA